MTDFRGTQENENLLKTRQSEIAEETQIQCKVEKEFQQITNKGTKRKELQKS